VVPKPILIYLPHCLGKISITGIAVCFVVLEPFRVHVIGIVVFLFSINGAKTLLQIVYDIAIIFVKPVLSPVFSMSSLGKRSFMASITLGQCVGSLRRRSLATSMALTSASSNFCK
jgi:hypothetical protein